LNGGRLAPQKPEGILEAGLSLLGRGWNWLAEFMPEQAVLAVVSAAFRRHCSSPTIPTVKVYPAELFVETVAIRSWVRRVALARAAALGVKLILLVFVLKEIVLAAGSIPVSPVASDGVGAIVTEYISVAIIKVKTPTAIGIRATAGVNIVLPNLICLVSHRRLSATSLLWILRLVKM